jgi:hypothetical protein
MTEGRQTNGKVAKRLFPFHPDGDNMRHLAGGAIDTLSVAEITAGNLV